jgi:hypothetical protein
MGLAFECARSALRDTSRGCANPAFRISCQLGSGHCLPMRAAPLIMLSVDGLLAGGILSGCSPTAMGPITVFADPESTSSTTASSSLVSGRIGQAASWNCPKPRFVPGVGIRRLDAVALHRVRQRESQELARHSGQLARGWRVSEAPFSGFWTTFNPCRASVSGVQFSISVLMMPETRFESAETGSN